MLTEADFDGSSEMSHLLTRTLIAICHTRRKNPLIRLARVFVFVLAWLYWFHGHV